MLGNINTLWVILAVVLVLVFLIVWSRKSFNLQEQLDKDFPNPSVACEKLTRVLKEAEDKNQVLTEQMWKQSKNYHKTCEDLRHAKYELRQAIETISKKDQTISNMTESLNHMSSVLPGITKQEY